MIDLSFCCFRIPVDACFDWWWWLFWCFVLLCWRFVRSSIFFPLFPSFILFVFQKLVVVESLLICERMLIDRFRFIKLCQGSVVSLWLYVLCVQVPETSVSLVLVVGLCHFWLLFTGHARHLLLELILIFDFTVQLSLMDLEEEAVIGTWRKV